MVEENHVLTESDLEMKRPGDGISPMSMASVIGKKTKQRLNTSHKLKWEDIE
jgi:N,N'-diacetyllegionaminate synthase